jgi:hypothetical protein
VPSQRDEQEVARAAGRCSCGEQGLGERVADRAEPELVADLGPAEQLDDLS